MQQDKTKMLETNPQDWLIVITFMWTIYQQFKISSMCEKCPYLPANKGKKKNNYTESQKDNVVAS